MTTDEEDWEGTEDEHDELCAQVALADMQDDIDTRGACKELLSWVAQHGAAPDVQETIELIVQKTDYNKSTVKDWYREVQSQVSLRYMDVEKIVKIKQHDPDEDDLFEFHVTANGEPASFRISSMDLMSQRAFQTKMLELCHTKTTFEDWDEQLNEWLQQAEIQEEMAEPLEIEHQVARSVVESIGQSEATYDEETFKQDKTKVLLKDDEIWVRPELLDSVASSRSGEVSRRRLRAILDEVLAGNNQKVRSGEGYVNAWRFNAEKLDQTRVVDVANLSDDAEVGDDER